jgi:hypothetical protein
LGASSTAPLYSQDFNSYADGTRLASRYNTTNPTTFAATASPNVPGWDAIGYLPNNDTDTTGAAQLLRIYGGAIQQTYTASGIGTNGAIVHDFGVTSGIWDFTLVAEAPTDKRTFMLSVNAPNTFSTSSIQLKLVMGAPGSLTLSGDGITAVTVTSTLTVSTGDVLRAKLDATAKKIYFFYNGSALGNSAGYDVSAFTGTWTGKAGVAVMVDNIPSPKPGTALLDKIEMRDINSNSATAVINQQSGGSPWQKQIDITAIIPVVGASGAQYKIETEAGALVQGWAAMTFASGAASASFLLADHAYEGQKFRVLVRNIGGTVNTTSTLTATNSYVLEQPMLIGMNDSEWSYWAGQTVGRDLFEPLSADAIGIIPTNPTSAARQGILPAGLVQQNWSHWAEPYSATQAYPATGGYEQCRYQGLAWHVTDSTSRTRVAPSTADPYGSTTGWSIQPISDGGADASLVGLTADGRPTKLPDDPNLTIFFAYAWNSPPGRAPFTVTCKTQPGIALKIYNSSLGPVTLTQSPSDIAAGQFTMNFPAGSVNGLLIIDRANCTATLNSSFFLSGIPSYETGTPSADIGAPYASVDKLSDLDAFAGIRYVKPCPIERGAGGFTGTMTAATNTVGGVVRQWKYMIDTAQRLGHKYVKVHVPDIADASYITAMATFFRDNLASTIPIHVALSNEDWNTGLYWNAQDLLARANALAAGDAAKGSPWLLHCREHNAMVAIWKSVFGAAYASRVVPVLEWQAVVPTSTWQQGLDFENTYQSVGAVSIAPYFEGGIANYKIGAYSSTPDTASAQDLVQNAVAASDQTAFNNALDTRLTKSIDASVAICATLYTWLGGYSVSKGLSKNAIGLEYYEGGQHIVVETAGWDSGIGAGAGARAATYFAAYKRSAKMAVKMGYYLDQLALKAPGIVNFFCYAGALDASNASGWGSEDTTGNVTQEPYATIKTKALAYNV